MANFLPHELTNEKEIRYSIIDARKFLLHVQYSYKNLMFCDDIFITFKVLKRKFTDQQLF